jgi:hypothetical protein
MGGIAGDRKDVFLADTLPIYRSPRSAGHKKIARLDIQLLSIDNIYAVFLSIMY